MIKTIQTISELRSLRNFKDRRGLRSVRIDMPGSHENVQKLEVKINKGLRACGCETGAISVAAGFLALVSYFLIAPFSYDLTSAKVWLGMIGFLLVLALAGKAIGLVLAVRKLRLAIDEFDKLEGG